jgi:hypothetical protein
VFSISPNSFSQEEYSLWFLINAFLRGEKKTPGVEFWLSF